MIFVKNMKFIVMSIKCVLFSALCVIIASFYFCTGCSDIEGDSEDNIEWAKSIGPPDVERLIVYRKMLQYKNMNKKIKEIRNKSDIKIFIDAVQYLKRVNPNHPHFPNMWLIEIEYADRSKEMKKLLILQRKGYPERLYIEFPADGLLGGAQYAVSVDLYKWMKNYVWGEHLGRPMKGS